MRRVFKGKREGFSLVEVVIATGLCTYVLIVIAGLLPIGMSTLQSASQQTIETEVFNELWSEFNTTPFDSLTGTSTTQTALLNASTANPLWFDYNGEQLSSSSGAVYYVRCILVNSGTSPAPTSTVPAVDGGSAISGGGVTGPSLNFVRIQIGYHIDPQSAAATDPRIVTRSFLLVKRDGF